MTITMKCATPYKPKKNQFKKQMAKATKKRHMPKATRRRQAPRIRAS
jgi:hypothetical protein